jgi:hypothetical protein
MVEPPTGKLSHLSESFTFCFDSLIREFIASKFSGKGTTDVVVMRGIGKNRINCTLQVSSLVRINNFTLEITFHILDDSYLGCDIMIGREILSQDFEVDISQIVSLLGRQRSSIVVIKPPKRKSILTNSTPRCLAKIEID